MDITERNINEIVSFRDDPFIFEKDQGFVQMVDIIGKYGVTQPPSAFINEDGERVQGEGDQPAGKAASSTAVSDLVQAFDYAFENNMIPEIVRIREKLHSLGYDPKGNRIADV